MSAGMRACLCRVACGLLRRSSSRCMQVQIQVLMGASNCSIAGALEPWWTRAEQCLPKEMHSAFQEQALPGRLQHS